MNTCTHTHRSHRWTHTHRSHRWTHLLRKYFPTWHPGVLPLWVIPAKALGTGPSAPTEDNLKYLLAFAGVFINLVSLLIPCWFWHPPLSSWRLAWWRFPAPPTRNISTCKEAMVTKRYKVGCSKICLFSTFLCEIYPLSSGDRFRRRGWIVQDWSSHTHWGSCLPRPWEGSQTLRQICMKSSLIPSSRCWRWATQRRTWNFERRRTRRLWDTSTSSPTALTTFCMDLR